MPQFTIEVDESTMSRVENDLVLAVILQNARITKRFSPGPKVDAAAIMFLKVVAAIYVLLCVLKGLLDLLEGRVEPITVIVFVVASAVFLFACKAVSLRQRWLAPWLAWFDRHIAKRVKAGLKERRSTLPAVVTYDLEDTTLTVIWSRDDKELSRWQLDLSQIAYGLIGVQSIALYKSNRAQKLSVILFSVQPALVAMLQENGVQLETFSHDLFPEPVLKRGSQFL